MNMSIDLTRVIEAVVALILAVLTYFVIPILRVKLESVKANLTEQQQAMLNAAIRSGVFAAEQIYTGAKQGEQKKSYVLSLLESQGYQIDSTVVDAAIEAAVKELKIELSRQ